MATDKATSLPTQRATRLSLDASDAVCKNLHRVIGLASVGMVVGDPNNKSEYEPIDAAVPELMYAIMDAARLAMEAVAVLESQYRQAFSDAPEARHG